MDGNLLNSEKMKLCFDAFVEEYKEKSLEEKQKLLVDDLKEIIATFQKLCMMYNLDYELIVNREIVDINNLNYTADDFAEAVYVYIQMIKEISSRFLLLMVKNNN